MLITVVIVIILVLAVVCFFLLKKEHFTFTYFEETTVFTFHYSSGTVTNTQPGHWLRDYECEVGEQMSFWIRPYNGGKGTLIMTAVTCDITDLKFAGSTPALPVTLPNTKVLEEDVKDTPAFNTPSTKYNGPFLFIFHYDWYPQQRPHLTFQPLIHLSLFHYRLLFH